MKTSIAPFGLTLSRGSRMVAAGRGTPVSDMRSTRRAGLRLQVGALVDPRDTGEQIIDFGPRGRGNARARLALRARGDHAALLQHVFAPRQSSTTLLLVSAKRQMRVGHIVG